MVLLMIVKLRVVQLYRVIAIHLDLYPATAVMISVIVKEMSKGQNVTVVGPQPSAYRRIIQMAVMNVSAVA